jgi:hypothetical protein
VETKSSPSGPPSPSAVLTTREKREKKTRRFSKAVKGQIAVLITVAAVATALSLFVMLYIHLTKSYARAGIVRNLEPMLNRGRVFLGVAFEKGTKSSLVAFSPESKEALKIADLAVENIASVNSAKTRLVYLEDADVPSRFLWRILFPGKIPSDLCVLDGPERKIKVLSSGLPGEILSANFGKIGIWGDSDDRVFFTFVTVPQTLIATGYPRTVRHSIFDTEAGSRNWTGLKSVPVRTILRDVLFGQDETWVALVGRTNQLLVFDNDGEVKAEIPLADEPRFLIRLPSGDVALIADDLARNDLGNVIRVFHEPNEIYRTALELQKHVRRPRIDRLNGLMFYVTLEAEYSQSGSAEERRRPDFYYQVHKISLSDLDSGRTLGPEAAEKVVRFKQESGKGFYDLDIRSKLVIFQENGKVWSVNYDGSGRSEVWSPNGMRLHWVQVLYGN